MIHEATIMNIETMFDFDEMNYEVKIKCRITQEEMHSLRCGKVLIMTDIGARCPLCGAPL